MSECIRCGGFDNPEGCWCERIDALKAKLAEMEQERDVLRGALRGIQTMGIPALLDGESDYESAFRVCVRAADKALKEFYKTRPPGSGETSSSPTSKVVATEVSHATGANDSPPAGPIPAVAGPPRCPMCCEARKMKPITRLKRGE